MKHYTELCETLHGEKLGGPGSAKPGRPVIPIKILDNLNI